MINTFLQESDNGAPLVRLDELKAQQIIVRSAKMLGLPVAPYFRYDGGLDFSSLHHGTDLQFSAATHF